MSTRKWGSEKVVNSTTAGEQIRASVAALKDGSFVVTWQDGDISAGDATIRGQRYDAAGNKLGAQMLLAGATGLDIERPSITGLADGNFFLGWDQGQGIDVGGGVFTPTGSFLRYQFNQSNTGATESSAAVANLGFEPGRGSLMAWRTADGFGGTNVALAIFDGAGNSVTANPLYIFSSNTSNGTHLPEIAANPTGTSAVAVWRDNDDTDVKAVIVNLTNNTLGTVFQLPARDAFDQAPVVTWLSDQFFVAAWTREFVGVDGDISGHSIRARIFDASGSPATGDILVNSTWSGDQQMADIVALPGGGFAVAWEDGSQAAPDASLKSIRLQAFDGAGTKVGGEIVVNTTTTGDQSDVSLAALADGRVVVTWTDKSAGNSDIRMQIVDPRDGIVVGTAGSDKLYGHDQANDELTGAAGADTLYGLKGNDTLYGGQDADMLEGGAGDDTLFGGADSDVLRGGSGEDEFDGGDGVDTADFRNSAGVTAALDGSLAGTGEAVGDTFVNVENIVGSIGGADRLRGNNLGNTLRGEGGNDRLEGMNGNDVLHGGAGGDILDGGIGTDTADYRSSAGVVAGLDGSLGGAGEALGDTFISIENLQGSITGADTLRGNGLVNGLVGNGGRDTLEGRDGNDILQGGAGLDTLRGGVGIDILNGGTEADRFEYTAATELGDTVQDFASGIDDFVFRGTAFASLPAGALAANRFETSLGNQASNANIRFLFETDTTRLWFDADGSGGANAPVMVGDLQAGAVVNLADILIV